MMIKWLMMLSACAALAGCAAAPESQAQQADDAACTAQADAAYNSMDEDQLARTSQTGLRYAPEPNHVFDGEQLGAEHVRDSDIMNCEDNGNAESKSALDDVPEPTPHIVGP
jgi:hypothetical protein